MKKDDNPKARDELEEFLARQEFLAQQERMHERIMWIPRGMSLIAIIISVIVLLTRK